ncbi:hypothetical protein [Halopseudomonas aestusnigri]|jgi:hypothetical protein
MSSVGPITPLSSFHGGFGEVVTWNAGAVHTLQVADVELHIS